MNKTDLKFIIAFCLLVFTFSLAEATEIRSFSLKRGDGSQLCGYIGLPESSSFPIILGIQGSDFQSVKRLHERFVENFEPLDVCVVMLEKQGFYSENEIDFDEHFQSHCLENRIDDQFLLIEALRDGLIEGWNGQLVVLGASEGGVIATRVAAYTPETHSLVLFVTGGGMTHREQIILNYRKRMREMWVPDFLISLFLPSVEQQLDDMIVDPSPDKYFLDYTYLWWASFLQHDTFFEEISSLDCPIYYVHGTADEIIPVESADLLVEAFQELGKDNLVYRRLENFRHDVRLWPAEPLIECIFWLQEIL